MFFFFHQVSCLLFSVLASFASLCVMPSRLFFRRVNFHMMTLKLPSPPFSLTFVFVDSFIFLHYIIIPSLFHYEKRQRIQMVVLFNCWFLPSFPVAINFFFFVLSVITANHDKSVLKSHIRDHYFSIPLRVVKPTLLSYIIWLPYAFSFPSFLIFPRPPSFLLSLHPHLPGAEKVYSLLAFHSSVNLALSSH